MKDGIGEKYTRADHADLANQIYASYSKAEDARALASVIGEEDLSPADKLYLEFGRRFEEEFLAQSQEEGRSIDETLDLGWRLLSLLPKEELDRVDPALLDKKYTMISAKWNQLDESKKRLGLGKIATGS